MTKKNILKRSKKFIGRNSTNYSIAIRKVHKALTYATLHRKLKKRNFNKLWLQRIKASLVGFNLTYSNWKFNLKQRNVTINNKIFSDLTINENITFYSLSKRIN